MTRKRKAATRDSAILTRSPVRKRALPKKKTRGMDLPFLSDNNESEDTSNDPAGSAAVTTAPLENFSASGEEEGSEQDILGDADQDSDQESPQQQPQTTTTVKSKKDSFFHLGKYLKIFNDLVPRFDGKSSPEDFISGLRTFVKFYGEIISNADMINTFVSYKLGGEAKREFQCELEAGTLPDTVEGFITYLKARFGKNREHLILVGRYMRLQQKDRSLEEYENEFNDIRLGLKGVPDFFHQAHYHQGLNDQLKRMLLKSDFESLLEMQLHCRQLEFALENAQRQEKDQRYNKSTNNYNRRGQGDKPSVFNRIQRERCEHCQRTNHTTEKCRFARSPKCQDCGKAGHTSDKCWKSHPELRSERCNLNIPVFIGETMEQEEKKDEGHAMQTENISTNANDFIVNGIFADRTVRVQIDTGAESSFLTDRIARNLPPNSFQESKGMTAVFANGTKAVLNRLVLGELSFLGARFSVSLFIIALPKSIDVLLGRDFLAKYSIVLRCGSINPIVIPNCRQIKDEKVSEEQCSALECTPAEEKEILELKAKVHSTDEKIPISLMVMDTIRTGEDVTHYAPVQETVEPAFEQLISRISCEKAKEIICRYKEVFKQELPPGLPPKRCEDVKIEVKGDYVPYKRRPYPCSLADEKFLKEKTEQLVRDGKIIPHVSSHGAPALVVRAKGKNPRLVINYGKLNQQALTPSVPMPNLPSLFKQLRPNMKYFTLFDILSAYHQVRLAPESVDLTTFVVPNGSFAWKVTPMGLATSPSIFVHVVSRIFYGIDGTLIYVDDILIASETEEAHLQAIEEVLKRAKQHELYLNLAKSKIFAQKVVYLGHILENGQLKTDPDKVKAMVEFPRPRNATALRGFLGMIGFYRRFLPRIAEIAQPLWELTQKKRTFEWETKHDEAFKKLKELVAEAVPLALPDPNEIYELHADASATGIGAVLSQKGRPIAFFSQKLTKTQSSWSIRDREMLAICMAAKHWRSYLQGARFKIKTDHATLKKLQTQEASLSILQAKWLDFLAQLGHLEVDHIRGEDNVIADALSRNTTLTASDNNNISIEDEANSESRDTLILLTETQIKWADEELERLIKEGYAKDTELQQCLKELPQRYKQHAGYIWFSEVGDHDIISRICIPDVDLVKTRIIAAHHDVKLHAHRGVDNTYLKIRRQFYWPNQKQTIAAYIRSCDACEKAKYNNKRKQGLLQPVPMPPFPFHTVSCDFTGGFVPDKKTKFDEVWTVVDLLTKMVILIPTSTKYKAADKAKQFVNEVICKYGVVHNVISDRDKIFTSQFYQEIAKGLGWRLSLTTTAHPEADGATERVHRTLAEMLRLYLRQDNNEWVDLLPKLQFALNTTVSASTKMEPFRLYTGFVPRVPVLSEEATEPSPNRAAQEFVTAQIANWEAAKDAIAQAQDRQSRQANRFRREVEIKAGDWVLVDSKTLKDIADRDQPAKKGRSLLAGPYLVTEQIGINNFKLALPHTTKAHNIFHASKLKKYWESPDEFDGRPPPQIVQWDGHEPMYAVKDILDSRGTGKKKEYLVKWLGYKDPTWEPAGHLQMALQKYEESFLRSIIKEEN